jgi:hypothetical protein
MPEWRGERLPERDVLERELRAVPDGELQHIDEQYEVGHREIIVACAVDVQLGLHNGG